MISVKCNIYSLTAMTFMISSLPASASVKFLRKIRSKTVIDMSVVAIPVASSTHPASGRTGVLPTPLSQLTWTCNVRSWARNRQPQQQQKQQRKLKQRKRLNEKKPKSPSNLNHNQLQREKNLARKPRTIQTQMMTILKESWWRWEMPFFSFFLPFIPTWWETCLSVDAERMGRSSYGGWGTRGRSSKSTSQRYFNGLSLRKSSVVYWRRIF